VLDGGRAGQDQRDAFEGGELAQDAQRRRSTPWTAQRRTRVLFVLVLIELRGRALRKQQLQVPQRRAMCRMQEPKRAYAMKAFGRHVLQEATHNSCAGSVMCLC
jgi:hypothetical protein